MTLTGAPAAEVQRVYIDPLNKNIAYVCFGRYGVAAGLHVWKTSNLNTATPTWAASGTSATIVLSPSVISKPNN